MAEHEYGTMDVTEQQKTYDMVMKWGGQWGTGFSIGLGLFFTLLLLNAGIIASMAAGIFTMFATVWIAKTFFEH